MGRVAEGWQLRTDPRTGIKSVRFRHEGKRHDLSTGSRDPKKAATEAAKIYSRVVGGLAAGIVEIAGSKDALVILCATWIDDVSPTINKRTRESYEAYIRTRFVPTFGSLSEITTTSIATYMRERLSRVLKSTVKRELAGLSSFLTWCVEQGKLKAAPEFPKMVRRATGTRARNIKTEAVTLSQEEIAVLLAALPEWSSSQANRFPVRARLVVAWETSLRPSTLARIRAPKHYRRGAATLTIEDQHDKSQFGRELPLSDAARVALDSVCPDEGLIFGEHRFDEIVAAAASRAGLSPEKAALVTSYDLRHNRIRTWLDAGAPLTGVAFQAGHKHLTTTNRYVSVKASADAAKKTLALSGGYDFPIGRDTAMSADENEKKTATLRGSQAAGFSGKNEGLATRTKSGKGRKGARSGGRLGAVANTEWGFALLSLLSAGNDEFVYAFEKTLDPEEVSR